MSNTPWPEIDEEARRRFEAAWVAGAPVPIDGILARVDPDRRLATLEELVCIELEFRWRRDGAGPSAEALLQRHPELDRPPFADRIRAEVDRVQARFGTGLRREAPVGEGGMGRVWQATDPVLGRPVALKELREGAREHPELRRRFLAEARVTAQLEHPGVVPVYQLVEDASAPYYTMKLVQGRTLTQAAAEARTLLARRRLLEAFLTVVRTVAFAHARGVVHRDLKPDNLLLGAYGETLVLDWGLARAKAIEGLPVADDPVLTQAGTLLGTPAYMSPEQAEGEPADERSDQYALGAVLHELLTGAPPYAGSTVDEVLDAVRAGPPEAPRRLDPSVPPELDAICRRAMARRPEDRYPSAEALAEDLERTLAGEPTEAWPEPWTRRALRWARTYRTAVGIGLTAVVMGSVAGGIGLLAQQRAQAQEARRVAALVQSLASAEEQARADLRSGRYREARDRLVASLSVAATDPELHGSSPALLDRATALATFTERAEEADRLAFLGFSGEAVAASEQALAALEVLDHADWWFALPDDLPPERIDELQWAAWHQLQLLASLLAPDHCNQARAFARHAGGFRPSPTLERALACEPREPCLSDGSGSYWAHLEQARCTGQTPPEVREGLGHALRARSRVDSGLDPREVFGDLQAALDRSPALAEVHWLAGETLERVDTLWGNETARAYARAIELELAEDRPRSPAATERLNQRLDRAAAFASRPVDPENRGWLEPDRQVLRERVTEARSRPVPSGRPVPAPTATPVDGPPRRLAVLNGGFELGLARHWGRGQYESERPIWWNSLTARSTAEVVHDEVHSGHSALHLVHESAPGDHLYGTTTQAIPAEKGARYRLIVWARRPNDTPGGGMTFPLDARWEQFAIAIPPSDTWTRHAAEFTALDDTLHLRMLTLGPMEAWLDDIAIERVDPPSRQGNRATSR